MADFPLILSDYLGHWGQYSVYFALGIAFGAVLEMSGFGNSPTLAAQFYLRDMTVLKVMFTAIVVAMLLILFTSAIGLLDYNLVWVNPTYMLPGIVGGLIMGVGFIIGGFCPGTSIVAAATAKIDGIFFFVGVLFGIFMFGETVGMFTDFFHSSNMGRYTIQDMLGVDAGVVAFGVVVMALGAFAFAEWMEKIFGGKDPKAAPKWRYGAAGGGLTLGLALILIGQPTTVDRWNRISDEKEKLLAERAVQIHPAELLHYMHDDRVSPLLLDVRSEADYNYFHLRDAVLTDSAALPIDDLLKRPANTLIVVMSNDEIAATAAWKTLVAESVPNVYILGGGVNGWVDTFADDNFKKQYAQAPGRLDDLPRYVFPAALGARHVAADPNPDVFARLEYVQKVKLEGKRAASGGGCG